MFAFYESEYSHILMLPNLKIEAVSERDIDLLILEELTVSQEFAQFFVNEVGFKNELKSREVYHSVTESDLGESDLILLCNNSDGQRNAILIENKIDVKSDEISTFSSIKEVEILVSFLALKTDPKNKDHIKEILKYFTHVSKNDEKYTKRIPEEPFDIRVSKY